MALWLNLETVATVLLAGLLFREHLHRRTWLGVFLIIAASLLLASPPGPGARLAGLLVALASVCWGLDNNLTALIDGLTPAQTTLLKGLVAGTINLCLGVSINGGLPPGRVVAAALLVGALSYGLSLVLYISGAQQLGAARAQMMFSTAPFWGVVLAWPSSLSPFTWFKSRPAPRCCWRCGSFRQSGMYTSTRTSHSDTYTGTGTMTAITSTSTESTRPDSVTLTNTLTNRRCIHTRTTPTSSTATGIDYHLALDPVLRSITGDEQQD